MFNSLYIKVIINNTTTLKKQVKIFIYLLCRIRTNPDSFCHDSGIIYGKNNPRKVATLLLKHTIKQEYYETATVRRDELDFILAVPDSTKGNLLAESFPTNP